MSGKHTPGPWEIHRYDNYQGFSIFSDSDPDFGCIAERWENINDDDRRAARKANADLITVAPAEAEPEAETSSDADSDEPLEASPNGAAEAPVAGDGLDNFLSGKGAVV